MRELRGSILVRNSIFGEVTLAVLAIFGWLNFILHCTGNFVTTDPTARMDLSTARSEMTQHSEAIVQALARTS
ncbi:MAG: hypothetical protein JWO71_1876 [Candidatus Acidoferrum typicum]|nr:hypothetical protein [Candidatus Acidoferrum typicum]